MKTFCYLGDMISCYGGASDLVIARISSVWKKFRELSGVLEVGFIFEATGEDLLVSCETRFVVLL